MASTAASPRLKQQQPVMSLLEKYSNIHRGIDQAREETDKMRLQIEQTNQGIEGLLQERESMQTETEAAQQDQKKLEVEAESTLASLVQLEQDHAFATSKKQQAKTKMQTAQQIVQDHRRTFLETSRNFRSSCKRLCVRAGLLGLKHAPLQAYIVVKNLDHQVLEQEDQKDEREDDAEMKEANERLESSRDSRRQTKQERDKCISRKRMLQEKAETRKSRKLQLQSQLDRIQKDIGEFETQVSNLNEQTAEAREMASSYEHDVRRRREQIFASATPSVSTASSQRNYVPPPYRRTSPMVAHNPYAKRNSTSSRSTPSASELTPRTAAAGVASTHNGPPRPPHRIERQQQPHRVGRIRASRQFGSTLKLSPTTTAVLDAPSAGTMKNSSNDDDDDDDEDNALLSYVAFGK